MDGSKGTGASGSSLRRSERVFLKTPAVSAKKSSSFNKGTAEAEATVNLPRDYLFRPEEMVSKHRYRTPALPERNIELADPDELLRYERDKLEELKDVLSDHTGRLALIAQSHPLHNWLVMQSAQIEKDFESASKKNKKKAQRMASCLDDICEPHDFKWREQPLSLDYMSLKDKKDEDWANALFKGDDQEVAYQQSQQHSYFPPWAEARLNGHSLAKIYNSYWEIRQQLSQKAVDDDFTAEDFIALYPLFHRWLQTFEALAAQQNAFSPEQIESFKYLLDDCDTPPNQIPNKSKWSWRDVALMAGKPSHITSDKIKRLKEQDSRLNDLDSLAKTDASGVSEGEPESLTVSIPRNAIRRLKEQDSRLNDSDSPAETDIGGVSEDEPESLTVSIPRGELFFQDEVSTSSDSGNEPVDDLPRFVVRPKPGYHSPQPMEVTEEVEVSTTPLSEHRKREATSQSEAPDAKRLRESPPQEESLSPGTDLLSNLQSEWFTKPLEAENLRCRMLPLDSAVRYSLKDSGLGKAFPQTANSFVQNKRALHLDTYDYLSLPMLCVEELAKQYDEQKELLSDTGWFNSRLTALKKIIDSIDHTLEELEASARTRFQEMMGEKRMPENAPDMYKTFCEDILKIRQQYQEYLRSINSFEKYIETNQPERRLARLRRFMDAPPGWIVRELSSAEQWKRIQGRRYHKIA